ncbi:hypothetical protein AB6E04_21645 [Vibrio amylolyticus]|uniref:hypothetical protein n=1 Tax=Vibrio amylolyticus TaxID=2847292 RepID=UPI0035540F7B
MKLAGIDLAWNGEKNPSAIAIGKLIGKELAIESIEPTVFGLSSILSIIDEHQDLMG